MVRLARLQSVGMAVASLVSAWAAVSLSVVGCSEKASSGSPGGAVVDASAEAGTSGGEGGIAAQTSKQTGRILRAQSTDGVAGATVTIGQSSTTTKPTGEYEILVPRGTPYQMTVTADGFFKLLEQEWTLNKDTLARGDTNLLITQTATLLANFLTDRKKEKGILVVKIELLPPCTSENGSTLTIDPPGEAKVSYFSGNIPDTQQLEVHGGSLFSGVFYNVDVGVPVTIAVTSPTCKQVPFPLDFDDVSYTGNNKVEADESLSYHRVFLKDPLIVDAGAD